MMLGFKYDPETQQAEQIGVGHVLCAQQDSYVHTHAHTHMHTIGKFVADIFYV